MKYLIIIALIISFTSDISSQRNWLVSYEEGVIASRESDLKMVLELGSIYNEFALFLPDSIWNSDTVTQQLINYIPVSVQLEKRDPLVNRFKVEYTPTILITDDSGTIYYKISGTLQENELASILHFYATETNKLERILKVYRADRSDFAHLQKAEEFIYSYTIAPDILKNYFLDRTLEEIQELNTRVKEMDEKFKERTKILVSMYEFLAFSDNQSIKKLKKLSESDMHTTNKALLYYYMFYVENKLGNFDKTAEYGRKLETQKAELPQGIDYFDRVNKLIFKKT